MSLHSSPLAETNELAKAMSEGLPDVPPPYRSLPPSRTQLPLLRTEETIAAEALTRLTGTASPPTPDEMQGFSRVASPLSVTGPGTHQQIHPIVQLVNTIYRLPLVTNAVRYYETSKRNYATFSYAAGIVEKAAIPVFNRIEDNLNSMHQNRLEERARIRRRRRGNVKRDDKTEIKKRIKFCLHILKLANDKIKDKVNHLQQRILEPDDGDASTIEVDALNVKSETALTSFPSNEITPQTSNVPQEAEDTNTEVVATVRKIIHVISNFRPSSLSVGCSPDAESAHNDDLRLRSTIRQIILNLPTQMSQTVPGAPQQAIIFAKQSLDMIGNLTNVFKEQLDKAENWADGLNDPSGLERVPSRTT